MPTEAELSGVRGRIQVSASVRRMLPQHGRVACEYDELSVDTLPNRILLATIRRLIEAPGLDQKLHDELRALSRSLSMIRNVHVTKQLFRTVQLHGNNAFYKFLLNLCELILDASLSTEEQGQHRFRDFVRDPRRMAELFEAFVYNFYRRECHHFEVRSERIYWTASSEDDPGLNFLPSMQTDIFLRSLGRTIIMDTKFYPTAADTLLAIEVSESTLRYDRQTKMPLYARHGIPELWIIDAEGEALHVFRHASAGTYADVLSDDKPGAVPLGGLPGVTFDLSSPFR